MSAVFPNSSQPYIVRKGLTMDLGLRWWTGLASQRTAKIYLSLQPTPALGLQMNASSVNVGARDLNSSPHACMVGTLPTEPVSAPSVAAFSHYLHPDWADSVQDRSLSW